MNTNETAKNALTTSFGMMFEKIKDLEAENAALLARVEGLEDIQRQICNWIDAYPLSVFPEPDFEQVRKLLEAGGVTLDCVSASNMRHVLNGINEIIEGEERK